MNYNSIKDLADKGFSTRAIAKELEVSQTNIRYWLGKYNLSTTPIKPYKCSFCGETDKDKFYGNKHTRCGKCHNKDTIKRGNSNKEWAVALLGGKCVNCGYCKSSWALQFHHTDPKAKDKNFSSMKGWGKKRIEKELEGCVILCANCHAEEHELLSRQ